MKNRWSFSGVVERKRRTWLWILLGVALFILGFFAARPVLLLFGLVN